MSTKAFKVTSEYDDGEWYDFLSWDHGDAAEDYADSADSNSGGEFADGTIVTVKEGDNGEPKQYAISVDYEKTFTAYPHTTKGTTIVNDGRPV